MFDWWSRLEAGRGLRDCRNDAGPPTSVWQQWFHYNDVWPSRHAAACHQPGSWYAGISCQTEICFLILRRSNQLPVVTYRFWWVRFLTRSILYHKCSLWFVSSHLCKWECIVMEMTFSVAHKPDSIMGYVWRTSAMCWIFMSVQQPIA